MKKTLEKVSLSPNELLRDSRRQATSLSLPLVIHYRLDRLAELTSAVGATRSDLIGALVDQAGLDAEQLERLIVSYRKKTVGEAMPPEPIDEHERGEDGGEVVVPLRRPGRPAGRKAAS